MRWRWISWVAVLVGVALGAGCSDGDSKAPQAEHRELTAAAVARAPEQRARSTEARARAAPRGRAPGRATAARARLPARPRPHAAVAAVGGPSSLDEELARLEPAAAIELLERIMGRRFEGAHYVLQRGSEADLVEEGWYPLSGELSLIDCADPEEVASAPSRSHRYWVGGLALEDPPENLLPAFKGQAEVPLFGGPGVAVRSSWKDLEIRGDSALVTGFGREFDLWLEAESGDHATLGSRQLALDAEAGSLARFQREEDACPLELDIHLVLRKVYTLYERSDEHGRARVSTGGRETTPLGRVTLIARQVSSRPEIFDLDQRGVRVRASRIE